jgi:hypothetical protein
MTSDEFSARYRLLKCITENGVHSYTAQELRTGRAVMVHFLDSAATDANQLLLRRIAQLPPPERARVSDTLEVDGTPVVVTQVLQNFHTLPDWVAARLAEQPTIKIRVRPEGARPAAPPPPAGAPGRGGGDFTRLFGGGVESAPPPASAPPARPEPTITPGKPPAPAPPAPAPSAAGGFTELFKRAAVPGDAPAEPPPPAPGGGEFTRFFEPLPVIPPSTALPPPVDRYAPPPLPPLPPLTAPSSPPTFPGFPVAPAPERPAPKAERGGSDAPAAPPPAAGPSEYTRLIAVGAVAPAAPVAPAPKASPVGEPPPGAPLPTLKPPAPVALWRKSFVQLVALLTVLAAVAVALVAFLASRR